MVRSVGGTELWQPTTYGRKRGGAYSCGSRDQRKNADLISLVLAAQGQVHMHIIVTSQTAEDVTTFVNVIGDLKGSEHPEQVVIVSGHLDPGSGEGRHDDAAGVAVAMETAQLMQQLHLRPRRTLRVIAWIDEENLGRGHLEYAKTHAAEIGQHVAAMESDLGASRLWGSGPRSVPKLRSGCSPCWTSCNRRGQTLCCAAQTAQRPISSLWRNREYQFSVCCRMAGAYFNYHHTGG